MTTTNEKMTKRDIYSAMIEGFKTGTFEIDADVAIAHFEREIENLDKKAAKAKAAAEEKRVKGDELTDAIRAILSDEPKTLADIATEIGTIGDEEVTASKVQYRANQLVKNGEATKVKVTIAGEDGGKARDLVAFVLPVED